MPNKYYIHRNSRNKNTNIFDVNHLKEIRGEIDKITAALRDWQKFINTGNTTKNATGNETLTKLVSDAVNKINSYNIALDKTTGILSDFNGLQDVKKLEKQLANVNSIVTDLEKASKTTITSTNGAYGKGFRKALRQLEAWNKVGDSHNLGSFLFANQLYDINQAKSKATKIVVEDFTTRGVFDREHLKDINADIDVVTRSLLEESGFKGSIDRLNIASATLNTAGTLLQEFAKSVLKIFKDGIEKQSSIYEATFHNISTRTGMTRGQYKQFQRGTNAQLKLQDLNGSVGVYEAQEVLSKLVDLGMNQENATASALDAVITSKIVPYLDTTSKDFNLINTRLDNKFVKDIRGINAYNADIAGNNYLTSDLLNKIIDMVQPMSDEALQNLAQSSGNFTAAMNYLMSAEGGNLSYNQAIDYWNQIYKQQNYAGQIMRSGTVAEKLTQIGYIEHNVDLENPNNFNRALSVLIDLQNAAYMGPGYGTGNQLNNLIQSEVGDALGFSRSQSLALEKLRKAGVTGNTLMNLSDFDISKYSEGEFTRLQNNETSTAKEIEKFWLGNKGTTLATINETLTSTTTNLIKTIAGIGTATIGGKLAALITKNFGLTAGKGLSTVISAGGGVALGTISAAAIALLSKGVIDAIDHKAVSDAENYLADTDLAGNTAAKYGLASSQQKQHKGLTWLADATVSGMKGNVNSFMNLFGSNFSVINNRKYTNLLDMLRLSGLSESEREDYLLAFELLLASGGRLSDLGISKSELKDYVEAENGPSVINAMKLIDSTNLYGQKPQNNEGIINNLDGGFVDSTLKGWHYHRQGLAEVPYDNYAAMLHAGETVLTASTTAAINDMVMEYRNSQNQNYSLDAAIQNQTAQLIQKMDEIIHNMNLMSTTQRPINTASEKLRNNMLSMTSSLAFQN